MKLKKKIQNNQMRSFIIILLYTNIICIIYEHKSLHKDIRKPKAPSPPIKTGGEKDGNSDKYFVQLQSDKISSNDSSFC